MSRLKLIAQIAAVVFIIGLIGSIVLSMVIGSFNILAFDTIEIVDNAEFDGSKYNTIEIKTSTVDVELTPNSGNTIEILLNGKVSQRSQDHYKLETETTGDTLKIKIEQKNRFVIGFNLVNLKLHVSVPQKLYAQFVIDSATGDLTLENLNAERMTLSTSTGDIRLSGYKGRELMTTTKTGDVLIQYAVTPLVIETSTGDIRLRDVVGALEARTSTGDIAVYKTEIKDDMKIQTSTGDVQIYTANEPEAIQLDFSSSTGDTTAQLTNLLLENKENRYLKGYKGEDGPYIQVRTSTGDIDISKR